MKLSDLGEDRVIAELTKKLPLSTEVKVGVGDDCAVIGTPRDKQWELLKTDSLIEGVHFTKDADPKRVGWKALARAISDIAAMGGLPKYAMITLAVSPEEELARVKAIYSGLKQAARRFNVSIVGGETSRSLGGLFLSIALTGVVPKGECVLRSGGRVGNALYVTGRLGGSIRGKHLSFIPRVEEARWLVTNFPPNAMMDLSDGLGADLPRLARASGVGFEIARESLPLNPGCSPEDALKDGEDFELLFAIAPSKTGTLEKAWKERFPKLPLTRIGQLVAKNGKAADTEASSTNPSNSKYGFDHFA